MTEDEICEMFYAATETFPPEHQKAAEDWLCKARAALRLFSEIETKGLVAVFDED